MSENVEKKRENGYYWVFDDVGNAFMVQVDAPFVNTMGTDDYYYLENFDFEFASDAPLKPPVKP